MAAKCYNSWMLTVEVHFQIDGLFGRQKFFIQRWNCSGIPRGILDAQNDFYWAKMKCSSAFAKHVFPSVHLAYKLWQVEFSLYSTIQVLGSQKLGCNEDYRKWIDYSMDRHIIVLSRNIQYHRVLLRFVSFLIHNSTISFTFYDFANQDLSIGYLQFANANNIFGLFITHSFTYSTFTL